MSKRDPEVTLRKSKLLKQHDFYIWVDQSMDMGVESEKRNVYGAEMEQY